MIGISALHVERWADQNEARHELPRLVRLLILRSRGALRRIAMPAGEGVQRPGWDGVADFAGDDPWVPDGLSVWEIGTGKDPAEKANSDYRKRLDNPGVVDPAAATFIFVTPRNWPGKDNWARDRQAEGRWRDIRAYDAQDLEAWLERDSAPAIWLAQQIGLAAPGLRSFAMLWADYARSTDPELSTDLVLKGREAQQTRLVEWLDGGSGLLQVRADSPSESAAFVAAAVEALPAEEQEQWQSSAVVASTEEAWRTLAREPGRLIVLLLSGDPAAAGQLKAAGHRVIVPLGLTAINSENEILLSRLNTDTIADALQNMGVDQPRAKTLAKSSGRSLLVLRRLLGIAADLANPAWANADAGIDLVAGLLAGGWDEALEGDRGALARLADKPYERVSDTLSRWVHESDTPFRRAGPVLRLTAPLDAWRLLSRYISRDQLERYQEVALTVLGTPDPAFELHLHKRWTAGLHGKARPHSSWLREGLAEGLVLLATQGEQAGANTPGRAEDWVQATVAAVLRDASGVQWASLHDVLPLLAEAAPEAVLDAIETGLEGHPPPLLFLFEEEGDAMFGRCHHCDLLWALETLAWEPAYLTRVSGILATLARLDPGGQWANRPANSLKDIFISWLRHTAADVDEKLAAIDYLIRAESDVAWKLMMDLLPGGHDSSSGTQHPRWRDWDQAADIPITVGERNRYLLTIAERALANVNNSGKRRADLLDHLSSLPPEWDEQVVDELERFSVDCRDDEERMTLWQKLREILHHHRSFPEADWSLAAEILDRLGDIYDRLEPTDHLSRFAWLFNDAWPGLPDGRDEFYEESLECVATARRDAISSIFEAGGVALLLELARLVSEPHALGLYAAEVIHGDEVDSQVLSSALGCETSNISTFAQYFVAKRNELNPDWLPGVMAIAEKEQWENEKLVDLCLGLPPISETWQYAEKLGSDVDRVYWQRMNFGRVEESPDVVAEAVRKLLGAGRPDAAFSLVEFSKGSKGFPFSLIADVLEGLIAGNDGVESLRKFRSHEFDRVFELLDSTEDRDDQRLMQLEWQFLRALEHSKRSPRALHDALSNDPAFFALIVSWIYRSEEERKADEAPQPDEATKFRAEQAYHLLSSWKGVPGFQDGSLNSATLDDWIGKARSQLAASGHREVGGHQIGEMLARVPEGNDGLWPQVEIRNLLERTRSRDLEYGMYLGIINSRGATWRGTGGAQERELEEKYREMSRRCAAAWPRAASLLARIANSYAADAKYWDENAMRDDLRWG